MRKTVRFELEATYVGGGRMGSAEVIFEGGRFTFVLDGQREFEIDRDELVELVEETRDERDERTGEYPTLTLPTQADAEWFLRGHRGRVVNLQVRRKSGATEWRAFEVYSIQEAGGRKHVVAYQRDHGHFERIPLCNIASAQATDERFSPRYEIDL